MSARVPANRANRNNEKNNDLSRRPLRSLPRRLDDVFDDFLTPWASSPFSLFGNFFPELRAQFEDLYSPAFDLDETDKEYRIKVDLPGVKREDVKIEVQNNQLVISGERQSEENDEKKGRSHFRTRSYGSFERIMTLPANVDPNRIEAHFENGVLTVSIPKTEGPQARQIQIEGGGDSSQIQGKSESKEKASASGNR
ncbi:MAG: hypothetical protein JWQ35_525 [Bacteriovoracaceae bacterium]|nr:hypothetical protein [Bacteriovoracaceae bacterium]